MKGKMVGILNPMANTINRQKVSQAKIGHKALTKNGIREMAKPGTEKWNQLLSEGFS